MDAFAVQFNRMLEETFAYVMKVEQSMLKKPTRIDLTINEMHVLEAVGREEDCTISSLAEDLEVTLPSVTVSVNRLRKKGYVEKIRCSQDKRRVFVRVTRQGKKINAVHRYFHENMARTVLRELSDEERAAMLKGMGKVNGFLKRKLEAADG